jgi:lysophospholipase L1-like esterase
MVFRSGLGRATGRWGVAALLAAAIFVLLYVLLPAPSAAAWGGHGRGDRGHGSLPAQTYLALGDSLAFGYSEKRFEENLPEENPAAFETGYVNDFAGALRIGDPRLQIVNDGCPGETTESFVNGPCAYQLEFPLHHPYVSGPTSSQLSDALAHLSAHPGAVSPITIDIGANDALGVVETVCDLKAACIAEHAPALFEEVGKKLGLILGELRAAAPHAQIIVLGLYNPFGSSIEGAGTLTADLNEVMAADAASVKARFADPLPFFNPPGAREEPTICLLTNMCTAKPDIHPTDLGYRVLAGVILRQYLAGLPRLDRGRWHGFAGVRRLEHAPPYGY